jgi:hypothetical protein
MRIEIGKNKGFIIGDDKVTSYGLDQTDKINEIFQDLKKLDTGFIRIKDVTNLNKPQSVIILESLIWAHHEAGVDVASDKYISGLKKVVEKLL